MRRRLFLSAVSLSLAPLVWCWQAWRAEPAQGQQTASLKDELEKGLRARFPSDFAFIHRVVTMVNQRRLPRDLVLGVFDWVRENKRHKRYLVAYFREILRREAVARGFERP